MVERRQTEHHFEVRIMDETISLSWVEVEVSVISFQEKKMLVTARNIAEQRLLQNIVKLYVYSNCDYFICLDAKNNRFDMLWGQSGQQTIPAQYSEDYVATFFAYIDTYVVPEDRQRVKEEVLPGRILSVLAKEKEHTISYGLMEPGRGYARKRIQYLLYDREAQTVLLSRTDVTDLYLDAKRQNEALQQAMIQAQSDLLTGVYNHHTIKALISEELSTGQGMGGALLFIDLDNFKQVNDMLGHQEGDEVLRFVAQTIRRSLRAGDLVGRVGGDEFIVYLCGPDTEKAVDQCASRLCKRISQYRGGTLLTCSIGIAIYPKDGKDYATLYRHADEAMYHAKTGGKAGYTAWSSHWL